VIWLIFRQLLHDLNRDRLGSVWIALSDAALGNHIVQYA